MVSVKSFAILVVVVLISSQITQNANASPADGFGFQKVARASADRERGRVDATRKTKRRDEGGSRRDHRGDRDDRHDDRADRRDDRYDDRRHDRRNRYLKFRLGMRILSLPARYHRVTIGRSIYFYSDGVYYVQQGSAYIVVRGPIGARVGILPYGFRSIYVGPRRYFLVNSTYYIYAPATNDYVVVTKPETTGSEVTQSKDPIIYPASGQSEEQLDQDRYECHRWALDKSGFDPSLSRAVDDKNSDKYYRSLEACLNGRGYTLG